MNKILFSILFSLLYVGVNSQVNDSIIIENKFLKIEKNTSSGKYKITSFTEKRKYQNLKFVKRISSSYQIIDNKNKIYYIQSDGKKKKNINEYLGLCGTVPHYSLNVVDSGDFYYLTENETFYDYNDNIKAKTIQTISKEDADSVVFRNGKNSFDFTANFGLFFRNYENPRIYFLKKNNKYYSQENIVYDDLDFNNYKKRVLTKKDNLIGIYGIFEPQFTAIEGYEYYLARAYLPNGERVVIDIYGNIYK